MAERHGGAAGIERALTDLGSRISYPPTPQLAAAVAGRISADRLQRFRPPFPGVALWSRRKLLVLVALGILLVAGTALAARLTLGAIGIRIVPSLPTETPTAVETSAALGERVTLQEAEEAVGFPIVLPFGDERREPDAVFLGASPFGERVVLAWSRLELPEIEGIHWNLLLMELRTDTTLDFEEIAYKELDPASNLESVRVAGSRGFWITGPHDLVLLTPTGEQRLRVTGNVLIWESGNVTLRLESMLPLDEAIRIAETVA